MNPCPTVTVLALCFAFGTHGLLLAEEPEKPAPFAVRLADAEGKPIADATVGITAYLGTGGTSLKLIDGTDWRYFQAVTSDDAGMARFSDGRQLLGHLCLVARHHARKLVAVPNLDPERLDETVTITLQPECRVSGSLKCSDLEARNRELGWTNVYLLFEDKRAFGCTSEEGTYEFLLPPGTYTLDAYGTNVHHVTKTFTVEPDQPTLTHEALDLPATQLALLQGQPAPELEGVVAWKNSQPLKLVDLRGQCVLLDFWGYWCGPCIYRMPKLFELHDEFHDQGLRVIGIHVGLDDDVIDSVEKLDEKLSEIRQEVWNGREIPFPVALVRSKRTEYGPRVDRMARSQIAADYGVKSYPTMVLIDRSGRVVGRFTETEEGLALLEKTLRQD